MCMKPIHFCINKYIKNIEENKIQANPSKKIVNMLLDNSETLG